MITVSCPDCGTQEFAGFDDKGIPMCSQCRKSIYEWREIADERSEETEDTSL